MDERLKKAISELKQRGFGVYAVNTKEEARELLLQDLEYAQTVGIGGSMSIQQLDIVNTLQRKGKQVYWHWLTAENRTETQKKALFADIYLASANAVTLDGKLLFVDGCGNRTAAITFGPERVILVIGKNKLVDDEKAAVLHIRTEACPLNARRLNLRTPCALIGACTDCVSKQRMCNVFLTLERCPSSHPVEVILVDEKPFINISTFWRNKSSHTFNGNRYRG